MHSQASCMRELVRRSLQSLDSTVLLSVVHRAAKLPTSNATTQPTTTDTIDTVTHSYPQLPHNPAKAAACAQGASELGWLAEGLVTLLPTADPAHLHPHTLVALAVVRPDATTHSHPPPPTVHPQLHTAHTQKGEVHIQSIHSPPVSAHLHPDIVLQPWFASPPCNHHCHPLPPTATHNSHTIYTQDAVVPVRPTHVHPDTVALIGVSALTQLHTAFPATHRPHATTHNPYTGGSPHTCHTQSASQLACTLT